ncbi:PREDICTED: uncharacterized protein LOC109336725 isoform X2 [Lupinus angustifolius]|uniref:uncharacterized protein LOC109336725 isoform X2 n=1 Tax=Lupinus angustifolius TaxID=3871 RepID=UPI00092E89A7|nr:PREDICTED: uncharacterized protein LOC109336725 isoform X2 [Lupinus angustifolius]
MDLCCNDVDAVLHSPIVEADSLSSNSKIRKSKLTKESGQSSSSALTKLTSQIKKPPRRKTSPVNWFPRKKVGSYLERKIKMLQEVDGMTLTLDQTLGSSNPHYSRVLREKMAARDAAHNAIEAQRAALVEACWCRILRAARIPSNEAEAQLLKAEKNAAEAFEAAQAMGVVMFDLPNSPRKHCQVEASSVNGEGHSTHTVTASFETAFEVDREVAAAVKTAFVRLANCPSFNKDEFKELLRKISENPDADESDQGLSEFSSEHESQFEYELNSVSEDYNYQDLDSKMPLMGVSQMKSRRDNRVKLVDMMVERLKCLQEDELSSLATIVATYGLNAALAEVQNIKLHNIGSATEHTSSITFPSRRMSTLGLGKAALDGKMRKKQVEPELPSLDKFLVKHVTKLEREVCEAKKNRSNETEPGRDSSRKSMDGIASDAIPDLGSILVKKNYTKLGKDTHEAKIKSVKETAGVPRGMPNRQKDHTEVPSLDKLLVKHVSRLEKEIQEAKNRAINERNTSLKKKVADTPGELNSTFYSDEALDEKENINLYKEIDTTSKVSDGSTDDNEENKDGLEKMQAMSLGSHGENYRQQKNHGAKDGTDCESLDKILVKHVSRLEKEKMRIKSSEGRDEFKRSHRNITLETNEGGGLDQVLVKHKSRLEREKMAAAQQSENPVSHSTSRREARERELQNVWGGLSLGNIHSDTNEGGGLDQVLVKHKSRLEQEKMAAAAQQSENPVRQFMSRREAREKEMQEAWGGLSLGNSMKVSLSKLEREKAAWTKAEEEERRQQAMKAI